MENLVKRQREYFNTNVKKPVDFRMQQLQKLYDLIKKNEDLLQDVLLPMIFLNSGISEWSRGWLRISSASC
jgi:hypothetical protein